MDTMLDPQTPTPGPTPSPLPYDFYREVHKGLRLAVFGLITEAGAADYRRADVRDAVVDRVGAVLRLLHSHHVHEDEFIQPLIEVHAPELAAMIEAGHIETEQDMVEIELKADAVSATEGDDAVVAGNDLYQTLALFVAKYLAHMALEQGAVMSELRAAVGEARLLEVDIAIRTSIAPPVMCDFIAVMAPAMNVDERTDMLGGIKAAAPPEIFEIFRAAAERALSPADYTAVAARVGVA